MNELQEIKNMVTEQMETTGFVRPTLFVVGDKSQFRYICTSFPAELDDAIAPMYRFGKHLAAENPEAGRLLRAYIAQIALYTRHSGAEEPREVLLIHGVDVATNTQAAVMFEVFRDRNQDSMPFQELKELRLHKDAPVPQYPPLQAFVEGYVSFD